jgi:3-methyladenine DNA glycosylase AlkD
MNKTAVEWLLEKLTETHTNDEWKKIIKQAKEMEKQQIIEAYKYGNQSDVYFKPEQYYNETFKSE